MVPPLFAIPSTLLTVKGMQRSLVPIDREAMVQGLIKLWVAPQLSRARVWVILCNMWTGKAIIIEFF